MTQVIDFFLQLAYPLTEFHVQLQDPEMAQIQRVPNRGDVSSTCSIGIRAQRGIGTGLILSHGVPFSASSQA